MPRLRSRRAGDAERPWVGLTESRRSFRMTSEDVNLVEPADAGIQDAYNPFVQPQMDDPYPILSRARATEPVFFSQPLRSWVVTRYELVQEVLQNPTVFLSGGLETGRKRHSGAAEVFDQGAWLAMLAESEA